MLLFLLHSLGDAITDTYDFSTSYLLADKGSQLFFRHTKKTCARYNEGSSIRYIYISLSKLIPRQVKKS